VKQSLSRGRFVAGTAGVAALTFGGLLILAGRAADVFGQRRCLMAGLAIFGAGSLVAAAAPNLTVLIGARVLQGLGGAILTPSGEPGQCPRSGR